TSARIRQRCFTCISTIPAGTRISWFTSGPPRHPPASRRSRNTKPVAIKISKLRVILRYPAVPVISRRSLLRNAALGLTAPLINRGRFALLGQSELAYSTLAIELVRAATVIDMLGLVTLDFRKLSAWQAQPSKFQATDFQRL